MGAYISVRITRPLRRLYWAALAAREGRFEPVRVTGRDEIATLARSFNETNETLQGTIRELANLNIELEQRVASRTEELSRSYDEIRRNQEVIQRELSIARRVQETIIPQTLHRERVNIDVEFIPISTIGGDLGFVMERSSTLYEVAVGDVTGHGIGAALVGNRVHTLLSELYATTAPLDSMLYRLDYFLSEEISDIGMFLTLAVMRFDLEKMVAEFTGGGHVAVLHYRPSDKAVIDLESRCGIVGVGDLLCETSPVMQLAFRVTPPPTVAVPFA